MNRRTFVALGGTVLLTGCTGDPLSETAEESTTKQTTETTESAGTTDDARTAEDTTTTGTKTARLGVTDEYSLGEWHTMDDWKVAVQSFELTATFRTDDAEETFEMPADEQLAIATAEVENTAAGRRGWAIPFAFVVDRETVYKSQLSFDYPEFEYEVDIQQLERVEHQRQFQPEGLPVDSGETERLWAVSVLPRSVSHQQVEVGLETAPDDVRYPIRWVPA